VAVAAMVAEHGVSILDLAQDPDGVCFLTYIGVCRSVEDTGGELVEDGFLESTDPVHRFVC
jgi:hypothetical protein